MIAVSRVLLVPNFKMYKLHCLLINLEVRKFTKLLNGGIFQNGRSSLPVVTLSNT